MSTVVQSTPHNMCIDSLHTQSIINLIPESIETLRSNFSKHPTKRISSIFFCLKMASNCFAIEREKKEFNACHFHNKLQD